LLEDVLDATLARLRLAIDELGVDELLDALRDRDMIAESYFVVVWDAGSESTSAAIYHVCHRPLTAWYERQSQERADRPCFIVSDFERSGGSFFPCRSFDVIGKTTKGGLGNRQRTEKRTG
jgi:hypothetical protein